jgi:hypothetical protein
MTDRDKLIHKYGDPFVDKPAFVVNMTLFRASELFPWCPFANMYVNKDLVAPLINTFTILEVKDLHTEIKTFDGCWNVRYIRGYEEKKIPSIHAWAMAIDLNAKHNPLGISRQQAIDKGLTPFTAAFQKVFKDTGWTCGYDFNRKDGMHFQITNHL